jgi:hypothetical protein
LLEAIRPEEEVVRSGSFHARNRSRGVHRTLPGIVRGRRRRKPCEHSLPAAEPGQTHPNSRGDERRSRFKDDSSVERAQAPESVPGIRRSFQPVTSEQVAWVF